jgi:hypothetical protein
MIKSNLTMKQLLILSMAIIFFACNNEKKPAAPAGDDKTVTSETPAPAKESTTTDYTPVTNLTYSVDGAEIKHFASILVSKDKDKLKAGSPYLCMLTSNAAKNNNEYLTVNFLLDTKPGTYPVVGASLNRGKDPNTEMYGRLLGGKPTLTKYNVTLTECKDLGSNNMGGHKWSISGYWDEMVIEAPSIVLMDKTKNHPKEIKLGKGSFTNLSFDDNWDEMMDQMKKK